MSSNTTIVEFINKYNYKVDNIEKRINMTRFILFTFFNF